MTENSKDVAEMRALATAEIEEISGGMTTVVTMLLVIKFLETLRKR